MASSKCSGCGGGTFEVKLFEPKNGRYKQNLVQCASCGIPVGVLDYFNLGAALEDRKKEIAQVASLVQALAHEVHELRREVQRP